MLRSLCAFAHWAFQSQSCTSSALSSSSYLRHHCAELVRNRVLSFRYVLRNLQMLFKALLQCLTCFKCSANVCQTNAFVSEFHVISQWLLRHRRQRKLLLRRSANLEQWTGFSCVEGVENGPATWVQEPLEARRGLYIPWRWRSRQSWASQCGCWDTNMNILEDS